MRKKNFKKNSICCIFNYASYYRTAIYQLMDKELECDFFLGDKVIGDIKPMDYNSLSGYNGKLKNVKIFGNFYWQSGAVNIVFKSYKHIIIGGEPYCVSNWIILILAKILGKKTYLWTHGWYGRETKTKKFIKKLFFNLSNHILLYGDYAKNLMINEGFQKTKLSCIYNSLDYEKQIQIRSKLKPTTIYVDHFNNNFPNLIFIGRLTSEKRFDLLLKSLNILKKNSKYFNLILIGTGSDKDNLVEMAKLLGLELNVWFYGACFNENELSNLIYNADLCVSPGNVGLTAMHSMVYGTPVITHNNYPNQGPEFEAILEGETGTFFEQNSIDSLTNSIITWFNEIIDRDIIRKNCYKIINDKYNPNYQINLLKKLLQIN